MNTYEQLVKTLMDETVSSYYRRNAISELGQLKDERAVDILVLALHDEDRYIRREAAKALGELAFSSAVEPLIDALEDSDESVQQNAITALGRHTDVRAIEPLRKMMETSSFFVRKAAEENLRRIEESLRDSGPDKELEVELDSSDLPLTRLEAEEEIPSVQEPPGAISAIGTVLHEVSAPEDSAVKYEEETEEITGILTESKEGEGKSPETRKLSSAEEQLIQTQMRKGAKGVILVLFEEENSSLQDASFSPGDVIRGRMLLHVAKSIKSRGIHLVLEAKEDIKWSTKSDRTGPGSTYHAEHTIIPETPLVSKGAGQIHPGRYEYPFEFRIPEDCPPSYSGHICKCQYSLSAYVDIPFGRDVKRKRILRVSRLSEDPGRQLQPISTSARDDMYDIRMSVILNDVTFYIGSKIRGTISFRNGSSKKIRGINVELYYQEFAYHYRNGKLNTWRGVKNRPFRKIPVRIPVPDEKTEEFQTDFAVAIPEALPETFSWHIFDVAAFVDFRLDIAAGSDLTCCHKINISPAIPESNAPEASIPASEGMQRKPTPTSTTYSPSGVWMSVTLKDSAFHIGSQVEGAIALQNPCGFRMRGIDVELHGNELIHSYSGKDSRSSMTRKKKLEKHKMRIPIQEDTVEEFKTDFSMKIPASIQETGQRRFSDIVAFVKITLDLGKTTNISCLHEIDILPATPAESI